ncbi:hypothetical protein EVAR_76503_1 [Eumeta japonica]|uniref:Uncharacterized protein n=1 Tax=Eumeta variegata TaxID=151549 RepID=A0A4C1T7L9_EUMVA|nr:hypothetical protein EVAR_76503_1 [Eumeta japonica]
MFVTLLVVLLLNEAPAFNITLGDWSEVSVNQSSTYLAFHQFGCLVIHPLDSPATASFGYPFIRPSIHLTTSRTSHVVIHTSIKLAIHISINPLIHPSVHLFGHPAIQPSGQKSYIFLCNITRNQLRVLNKSQISDKNLNIKI